jgi:thiol-disulfide isomerase/thioredoxin
MRVQENLNAQHRKLYGCYSIIKHTQTGLNGKGLFPRECIMNELLYSGLVALGYTLMFCAILILGYWMFRGFPPGSKLVEQALPTPNELDGKSAVFKLFYVDWCPHCTEAKEKLDELEAITATHTYGGKKIKFERTNCEVHKDVCQMYKVEAYPTYKLETSSNMYEYLGPASTQAYRTFLGNALGKEVSSGQ